MDAPIKNKQLHEFVMAQEVPERLTFCAECETSFGNMQHMMYGRRPIEARTAMLMELASGGKLKADKLTDRAPWARWLKHRKLRASK